MKFSAVFIQIINISTAVQNTHPKIRILVKNRYFPNIKCIWNMNTGLQQIKLSSVLIFLFKFIQTTVLLLDQFKPLICLCNPLMNILKLELPV